MADTVEIIFGAKIDGLVNGVSEVKHQLSSVQESTDKVTEAAKHMLEIFGIGLSLAGFVEFVNSMSELGEKLVQTSDRLGVNAEKIVMLSGMAKLTGTSLDGLAMSIERMSLNVQRASSSAIDPTAQALKVLGLNAKELIGLPTDAYFQRIAGAVEKFNPSLNLTNALMQIGGRSFANMMPILREGAEGWAKYQAAVHAASQGLAGAIPGMAETNTKIGLLSLSMQGLGARIFTVLKPSIDLVIDSVTKWVQSLDSKGIADKVQKLVEYTAQAMLSIGNLAIGIIETLAQLSGGLDPIIKKLEVLVLGASLGGSLAGLRGALVGAGTAAAIAMFVEKYQKIDQAVTQTNTNLDEQRERLAKIVAGFKSLFSQLNSGPAGEPDKGSEGKSAGAIDFNIGGKIAAQAANIDRQISMVQAQAERQKLIYQFDVDTYQITQSRKTDLLQAALNDEYAKEKALLEKKLALYAGQPEKAAEVQKQISALEETYTTNRVKTAQEGIRAQMASWKEFTDSLQSSFNSQLRGLLAGTTSWSQAFKSILGDMIIFFIQAIEKMVVNWLLGKAVMATADKTALVTQAATATAANAAAGAATVASIQQKVALVYAGAAAFFAPLLGPGAPAAAAAVSAEVDAAATGLALAGAAEQGAWNIPDTAPWLLHKGEAVLPAPAAQAFRDMAQGGSLGGDQRGDTHLHVHAIDAAGVMALFKNNARGLTKLIGDQLQGNPTLREAFK